MEKFHTRAAEGYPSCSQEAAGLKIDQLIRTPKSQSKWYAPSRLRQEGSQRLGKTIFGWSSSEARLNSHFSRIAKVSAYPTSGPASRPVPQEILRCWEKFAREGSLITNHAANFNRSVSEIQDPVKNKKLKESLQALIQKQVVKRVLVPSSLAFYNRLLLVPKPNNRWRLILDPS